MKVAIAGLAGSGKTTLFSALTGVNNDGISRRQTVGVIKVPDIRVNNLSKLFQPKKISYAEICFEDTGLLDQATFEKLRTFDEFIFVVDDFSGTDVLQNLKNLEDEFNIMDLALIEKRLLRLKKEAPKSKEIDFLNNCQNCIENGERLFVKTFSNEELDWLFKYRFFTFKPCIVVVNSNEDKWTQGLISDDLKDYCKKQKYTYLHLCAVLEKEIAELPEEEQIDYLQNYNIEESVKDCVIRNSYEQLGLISFFTVGADEVKAWTIKRSTKARQAAGKIHTDLERGFIRAEVVSYEIFMQYKDMLKLKSDGKLRVEGKDYIVQDGEILHVRFNV